MLGIFKRHKKSYRRPYVKAMMRAIDKARKNVWIDGKTYSKTFGLRVIKRFEKVNKTAFNPLDERHVELVTGQADNEHLFWKLERIKNDWQTSSKHSRL